VSFTFAVAAAIRSNGISSGTGATASPRIAIQDSCPLRSVRRRGDVTTPGPVSNDGPGSVRTRTSAARSRMVSSYAIRAARVFPPRSRFHVAIRRTPHPIGGVRVSERVGVRRRSTARPARAREAVLPEQSADRARHRQIQLGLLSFEPGEDLAGTPVRMGPARLPKGFDNDLVDAARVGVRGARAVCEPARSLRVVPREPLVGRLSTDSEFATELRHRLLALQYSPTSNTLSFTRERSIQTISSPSESH
jgi:hypothetical protein